MRASTITVNMLSQQLLHAIIAPEHHHDELFILNMDNRVLTYLILRSPGPRSLQDTAMLKDDDFRLLSMCPVIFVNIPGFQSGNELPRLGLLQLSDLYYSLVNEVNKLVDELDNRWYGDNLQPYP
jgi:hypothetical protein